jgi:hypothetical protein
MQDQPSRTPSQWPSPGAEDRSAEALVLSQILYLYPETLTFDELVRELSKGSTDFGWRDDVDRAVRELTGAGLLRRAGAFVLPTRAACHFTDIGRP